MIGANLCKKIKEFDCEIHVNFLNEIPNELNDIFKNCYKKQFDICDAEEIKKLEKYDIIFHCSGYGQPKKFVNDPEKTFLLNTLTLIELTNKVNEGGHFLFLSTSELYINSKTTKEEEFISIDPESSRNCYILGKLCGEQLLKWASKNKNFNYKNIRICLAFGEFFKKNDERVLTEIIFKALSKNEINLIDDGSAIRRYIYIEDAVKMILNIF